MSFPAASIGHTLDKHGEQPLQASIHLLGLLSDDERLCLMRCSVVRKFDEELFNKHFRVGDVRLTDLITRGWVQTAKGPVRRYWIAGFLRDDAWRLWWPEGVTVVSEPSAALKELSGKVASYCLSNELHIERLRQLAIADAGEAEKVFARVYGKADEAFDLAYCQDAVDALGEPGRAQFLPRALRDRLADAQRRIITRAMRESEFYQTRDVRFQQRKDAQAEFRGLLTADSAPWLLQLHGRGGIGKTTLLRWFISRECIRPDRTLAAAMINCDGFDSSTVLNRPWLLLLEAAEQLNRQLPESPFMDMVESYSDYRGTLRQLPAFGDAVTGDQAWIKHAGEDVIESFCRNAPRSGEPFVIALDSLDQVSLESRGAPEHLAALIDMLRRVHERISDLRVVLSGRDDLSKLAPRLRVEAGVRNVEVHDFDKAETITYLKGRGVTHDTKRQAILEKSHGMPMVVALYADWVLADPAITAEDIRNYSKPQVDYLITRILLRINDLVVRHALLYSVTVSSPCQLTLEYFRHVMLPLWREQAQDAGIPSELEQGRPPRRQRVPEADDEQEQQRLWKEILRHASEGKWLSVVEADGESVVEVHSDVRPLLIATVRRHPTFDSLHQQAAAYYQRKADVSLDGYEPGTDWPVLISKVLYHSIAQGDPRAVSYWDVVIAQARRLRHNEWVQGLAASITRQPDFRRALEPAALEPAALRPSVRDVDALPTRAVLFPLLYAAFVELARLAAQDTGSLPGHRKARLPALSPSTDLANARTIRQQAAAAGVEILIADYEIIVSALMGVEECRFDDALRELRGFTPAPGSASGDAWLVRARAHAGNYRATGLTTDNEVSDAAAAYQSAYEQHTEPDDASYIALDAAAWLLSIDRPDQALYWCGHVLDAWDPVHPNGTAAETRARVLLALGKPGSALKALERPPARRMSRQALSLSVEAQLLLRRPLQALKELNSCRDETPAEKNTGASDELPGPLIEHDLLWARVYRELLDVDSAEPWFSQAQRRLPLLGQSGEVYQASINTAQALFELRATGNIRQARVYLAGDFEPSVLRPGTPTWTDLQIARVELADRQEHADRVLRILDEIRENLIEARAPASQRVRASLAGLQARSLSRTHRRRYLERLADDLGEVVAPARSALLADLTRCLPVDLSGTSGVQLADRFRAIAGEGDRITADPASVEERLDQAWNHLVMSQVFRITRADEQAEQRRAIAGLELGDDPFAGWELLGARPERAASARTPDPDAIPPDPHHFRAQYGDEYPVLFAAYAAEWAGRVGLNRSPTEVLLWLVYANKVLESRPGLRPTAWHARLYEAIANRSAGNRVLQAEGGEIWASLGVAQPPAASEGRRRVSAPRSRAATGEVILSDGAGRRGVRVSHGQPGEEQPSRGEPVRGLPEALDVHTLALDWGQQVGDRLAFRLRDLADINVRLDFRRPAVAAQPWELTMVGGKPLAADRTCRFIFRTASGALGVQHQLIAQQQAIRKLDARQAHGDDLLSLEDWRSVTARLRERGRGALRVRLVQPVVGGSLDSERRFGERRLELEHIYRRAFSDSARDGLLLDLRTFYGDQVTDLYMAPEMSDWADVVHVCTVMEATEQMPVLNLQLTDGPPMTAPQLNLLVQRLTRTVAPLVILDVLAPPSQAETRRQLLMRNRFAHQLLTLGSISTIIASGLAGDYASVQWRHIAEGLARGKNAADTCRGIQWHAYGDQQTRLTEDDDAHAIAFQATALFTSIHPDRLTEPGLIR